MTSIRLVIKRLAPSAILISLALGPFANQAAAEDQVEPAAPKPSAIVQPLLQEAERQLEARQSPEALRKSEQAASVAVEQQDLVGEARAIRLRARALIQLNQVDDAIRALEAEASVWSAGGHGPEHVDTLVSLAIVFEKLRRTSDEEAYLIRAVEVAQAEQTRPMATADVLRQAAIRYRDKEKLIVAKGLFETAAVVIAQFKPESLDVAADLSEAGQVANKLGDFELAYAYLDRALQISRQQAPRSRLVANYLELLGNLVGGRGDVDNAYNFHSEALKLRRELAPHSVEVAASLTNLANVKQKLGDRYSARNDYYEALALWESLAPDSSGRSACLNNLGALLALQGDLEAAGDFLFKALELRRKLDPVSLEVASTLDNLGAIAFKAGDLSAAFEYIDQARAIREKQAPGSLALARSLGNTGAVLSRQDKLAEAGAYYNRALALKRELAPDSLTVASTLNNLGELASQQGDLDAAERHHGEALELREKLAPNSIAVANSLTNLANVAAKREQWMQAESLARRAWKIVREHGASVSGDQARQAFEVSAARPANTLIRAQLALKRTESAFRTLEDARANALRQLLAERDWPSSTLGAPLLSTYRAAVAARDRAESAISRSSVALAQAKEQLGKVRLRGGTPDELARAQRVVDEWTAKLTAAQVAYSRARVDADQQWRQIVPKLAPAPLSAVKADSLIGSNRLYVAFLVNSDETYVFVLEGSKRGSTVKAVKVDISQSDLEEMIKNHRDQVMNKATPLQEITESGRDLFQVLFPEDVRRQLDAAPRLVISPDGPLWDLPFASLVVNLEGRPEYLGARKALSYTSSLSLLGQQDENLSQPGIAFEVLVVGDPVFSRDAGGEPAATLRGVRWTATGRPPPRLPTTGEEATEVAKLYGSKPLLREQATEEAIRRHIERVRIIHFATHSYLHPVRAMNSGILLTTPKERPTSDETAGDGVLEAWEVMGQLQLKADLVVLSACETARGEVVSGEGVIGLARAFQAAGAGAVTATQWQVVDTSTGRFMVAFHQALRGKQPKDVALQAAVNDLLHNDGTAHPYYWAAFRLVGDSTPIPIPSS